MKSRAEYGLWRSTFWQVMIVALLAIAVSTWDLFTNVEHKDIIATLIRSHLSVLIPQSILLVLMMWQVLRYRAASVLIGIRHQSELVQKRLLIQNVAEVTVYFGLYYGIFFLSGNKIFVDGSVEIGLLLLLLRYFLMLVLAILIVFAYRSQHPGILGVLTLLISLGYHYWIEANYLLIMYSPLYDPLYRAIHHIYQ